MGADAFVYPNEAGLPIGGENFNRHVMLEVHYNNPELRSGRIDSSGIQFILTKKLRRYDAGVIELGLEYTDKMAIPPGQVSQFFKTQEISDKIYLIRKPLLSLDTASQNALALVFLLRESRYSVRNFTLIFLGPRSRLDTSGMALNSQF